MPTENEDDAMHEAYAAALLSPQARALGETLSSTGLAFEASQDLPFLACRAAYLALVLKWFVAAAIASGLSRDQIVEEVDACFDLFPAHNADHTAPPN